MDPQLVVKHPDTVAKYILEAAAEPNRLETVQSRALASHLTGWGSNDSLGSCKHTLDLYLHFFSHCIAWGGVPNALVTASMHMTEWSQYEKENACMFTFEILSVHMRYSAPTNPNPNHEVICRFVKPQVFIISAVGSSLKMFSRLGSALLQISHS